MAPGSDASLILIIAPRPNLNWCRVYYYELVVLFVLHTVGSKFSIWNHDVLRIYSMILLISLIVTEYRLQFLHTVPPVGSSTSRGMFLNSCYSHCQTELQETWLMNGSPMLFNKVIISTSILFSMFRNISSEFCFVYEPDIADNCKGSWGLVFRSKSISKDWLSIPLWQKLSQFDFWSNRAPWYIGTYCIEGIVLGW